MVYNFGFQSFSGAVLVHFIQHGGRWDLLFIITSLYKVLKSLFGATTKLPQGVVYQIVFFWRRYLSIGDGHIDMEIWAI